MAAQRSTLVVWAMIAASAALATAAGVWDKEPAMTPARFTSATDAICTRFAAQVTQLQQQLQIDPAEATSAKAQQALNAMLVQLAGVEKGFFSDLRALTPPQESGVSQGEWKTGLDRTLVALDGMAAAVGKAAADPSNAAATAEIDRAGEKLNATDPRELLSRAGMKSPTCGLGEDSP